VASRALQLASSEGGRLPRRSGQGVSDQRWASAALDPAASGVRGVPTRRSSNETASEIHSSSAKPSNSATNSLAVVSAVSPLPSRSSLYAGRPSTRAGKRRSCPTTRCSSSAGSNCGMASQTSVRVVTRDCPSDWRPLPPTWSGRSTPSRRSRSTTSAANTSTDRQWKRQIERSPRGGDRGGCSDPPQAAPNKSQSRASRPASSPVQSQSYRQTMDADGRPRIGRGGGRTLRLLPNHTGFGS
jgi:hypothetical protein